MLDTQFRFYCGLGMRLVGEKGEDVGKGGSLVWVVVVALRDQR